MKGLKIIGIAIVAMTVIGSIVIKRFSDNEDSGYEYEDRTIRSFLNRDYRNLTKRRNIYAVQEKKINEKIFTDNELVTEDLSDLLEFEEEIKSEKIRPQIKRKENSGKLEINNQIDSIKAYINESKIDSILGSYILKELKKLALKKSWNFHELNAKIHYHIQNLAIDVYVIWKISMYEDRYSHFDRFEIRFK